MNSLTPAELKSLMEAKESIDLVDVREVWEHENYNIGGKNIPLNELLKNAQHIDSSKKTVVYCEKGIRSAIAIQRLEARGLEGLYNLAGGVSRWRTEVG